MAILLKSPRTGAECIKMCGARDIAVAVAMRKDKFINRYSTAV